MNKDIKKMIASARYIIAEGGYCSDLQCEECFLEHDDACGDGCYLKTYIAARVGAAEKFLETHGAIEEPSNEDRIPKKGDIVKARYNALGETVDAVFIRKVNNGYLVAIKGPKLSFVPHVTPMFPTFKPGQLLYSIDDPYNLVIYRREDGGSTGMFLGEKIAPKCQVPISRYEKLSYTPMLDDNNEPVFI